MAHWFLDQVAKGMEGIEERHRARQERLEAAPIDYPDELTCMHCGFPSGMYRCCKSCGEAGQ